MGKRSLGSTMREDDADDIEDEDECVLSKLGEGNGRRRAVSVSIKWGFASGVVEVYREGKMRETCIRFVLVCFGFERCGRRGGGSVGFAKKWAVIEGSSSVDTGEDEEKGDAKNACVFAPEVECGGDGALAKEDKERSEKVDESEEDVLVLVLLGSEEREREDVVESAEEEETAAETAAEMAAMFIIVVRKGGRARLSN